MAAYQPNHLGYSSKDLDAGGRYFMTPRFTIVRWATARFTRVALAMAFIACLALSNYTLGARSAHAAMRTLHIAWFEFSPADDLQVLGNQYAKEHGIQIIVDRPPLSQWYTSVFNQFAAHKTSFAAAALDSQW